MTYTSHAGIWLLIPLLIKSKVFNWLDTVKIKRKTSVSILQLFLNMFVLIVSQGFERVFHLNHMSDMGLALFTGYRLLKQSTVSKLVAALNGVSKLKDIWSRNNGVNAKTLPHLKCGIAIDEHVIPYWGDEDVGKCRVPTRGRVMRSLKVFVAFLLGSRQHLCFEVTKGSVTLSNRIIGIVNKVREYVGTMQRIIIIADKGSYSGKNFTELNRMERVHYILPAKNTAGNKRQWNKVKDSKYREYTDPRNNAKYKLAVTRTSIKNCPDEIRTILLKDEKNEYTAFFTNFSSKPPEDVLNYYRTHWRQETSYRILKNDLGFDYIPKPTKVTDKGKSLNNEALDFTVWVKLYVANILEQFSVTLGGNWKHKYASSLVRQIIAQPGYIELFNDRIEVTLVYKSNDEINRYIESINSERVCIPWLNNKTLFIKLSKNNIKKRQNLILY